LKKSISIPVLDYTYDDETAEERFIQSGPPEGDSTKLRSFDDFDGAVDAQKLTVDGVHDSGAGRTVFQTSLSGTDFNVKITYDSAGTPVTETSDNAIDLRAVSEAEAERQSSTDPPTILRNIPIDKPLGSAFGIRRIVLKLNAPPTLIPPATGQK